jgi:hypothetical protein
MLVKGSTATEGLSPDTMDADRSRDVLDLLLAHVFECKA